MKTLSELLIELKSFDSDIDFVHDKTIEEFVADCPRGEWLLWLGKQIAIDRKKLIIACARCVTFDNMKCTGLKAVSYPDTEHLIKGNTVQFGTDARIFYIVCYLPFLFDLL